MTKEEFVRVMDLNAYVDDEIDTSDVLMYTSPIHRIDICYDINCEDLNVHVDDADFMSVGNFSTASFVKVNEFLKVCDMPQLLL